MAFTHDGLVRQLELTSITPDSERGARFAGSGFVRRPSDVYDLRYRIINPGYDDGEFRLWAELPATMRDDRRTPPIVPLGWELQLRSYLKLVFERTS